jgi:small ligand-binding sensory domain FIST
VKAASAIIRNDDWSAATSQAIAQTAAQMEGVTPDLALVFASHAFAENYSGMLAEIQSATDAPLLVGCSGQGIIGRSREIEGEPALSLLLLSLPGATLTPYHFTEEQVEESSGPGFWHLETGIEPGAVNAWMLLADPFHLNADSLVRQLNEAYPDVPIIGGMASGDAAAQETFLFLHDEVLREGATGVAIGGEWTMQAVVSQGCTPIGEPWTITSAEKNVIHQIARKPAYQVLVETFQSLSKADQQHAQRNLLVGLAVNEYQEDFKRGDFLIRNIMGVDPKSGSMAIGAMPRTGQTMQFQLRHAAAADEDMRQMLERARLELGHRELAAGLLCCCNGRGEGLFGEADHDAKVVADKLGPLPLAGFFCNGEIGPDGNKTFVHGFTASLGLFVRKV